MLLGNNLIYFYWILINWPVKGFLRLEEILAFRIFKIRFIGRFEVREGGYRYIFPCTHRFGQKVALRPVTAGFLNPDIDSLENEN